MVKRLSLEDLPQEDRQALFEQTMERLDELVEACGEFAPPNAHVASNVILDERGLLEMELFPYRDDTDSVHEDLDMVLPGPLVDCLGDEIWDRGWPTVDPGSELPLSLTMPIDGDATGEDLDAEAGDAP